MTDFRKLVDPADVDKIIDDELGHFQPDSKKLQEALEFLQHLDPTGYLVSVADPNRPSPLLDESMMERNQRIETMTTSMDVPQYKEYTKVIFLLQIIIFFVKILFKKYLNSCYEKLKACSFKRNQPTNKFQNWLLEGSPPLDIAMTAKAWDILSFFAYETVAQIVDLAFLVRRDNEACQISDALEQNAVPRVSPMNAELNKVYIVTGSLYLMKSYHTIIEYCSLAGQIQSYPYTRTR